MIKRIILLFIFLTLVYYARGENNKNDVSKQGKTAIENKENKKEDIQAKVPKMTVSVDRAKARVGDLINLSLKYYLPEGGAAVSEASLKGLDGLTVIEKKTAENEIIFTIMIDKTASFDIGPVSLSFKDNKGVLNIIRTEALHIEVLSNLGAKPAEAQLKPIMDIYPTYPLWLRLLPWGLGLLLLIAAGAGIYYWRKIRREKTAALMDIKPAHVVAKEEIERLISMNLIDKGEYKEFYFRFSEILRRYLERLRGFPAAELTTEEISRRIRDDRDRKLLPVLRGADLVKFADAVPAKARSEEDIRLALDYIRTTTPVPAVAEQSALTRPALSLDRPKPQYYPHFLWKKRGRGSRG